MHIFRRIKDIAAEARGAVVAIGNFDGLHRGHQAVIGEAGRFARADGVPWAVLTFEPHPRSLFRPDDPPYRLTPEAAKTRLIGELGVDFLLVLEFDKAFSSMSAEGFVKDVLVSGLDAQHVVSGYDFEFGHGRKGNCELLLRMGKEEEFDFTAVQAVHDDAGEVFSSTRVREALRRADPQGARRILGRYFEIEGVVADGEKRGRTLGFPTANLSLGQYIRPENGIYAIFAGLTDEGGVQWYEGAANLGHRPTFDDSGLVLESYLFDFDGDLYGKNLRVALVEYLRPEKKFDGIDDLKAQIARDCEEARQKLARAERP